jgi:hypothetical protein
MESCDEHGIWLPAGVKGTDRPRSGSNNIIGFFHIDPKCEPRRRARFVCRDRRDTKAAFAGFLDAATMTRMSSLAGTWTTSWPLKFAKGRNLLKG